jgi:hypothetical protein
VKCQYASPKLDDATPSIQPSCFTVPISTVYRKQCLNSALPYEGYKSDYLGAFYTQSAQPTKKLANWLSNIKFCVACICSAITIDTKVPYLLGCLKYYHHTNFN